MLKLPADKRYEHFVKRCADEASLWLLGDASGSAMTSDDAGRKLIAVWPHDRYAQVAAVGPWTGMVPKTLVSTNG